jgi:hypothetical protein
MKVELLGIKVYFTLKENNIHEGMASWSVKLFSTDFLESGRIQH